MMQLNNDCQISYITKLYQINGLIPIRIEKEVLRLLVSLEQIAAPGNTLQFFLNMKNNDCFKISK